MVASGFALFGGHVVHGADGGSAQGEGGLGGVDGFGEAEVGNFDAALGIEEEVGGFDVAMNQTGLVNGGEAGADLVNEVADFFFGERFVLAEVIGEVSSFGDFHDKVTDAVFRHPHGRRLPEGFRGGVAIGIRFLGGSVRRREGRRRGERRGP